MTDWDAIVVGGGPAGSGAATYLAMQNRRVLLLERERFPRPHIGESLLPGVLPYLDALGAREAVERAGFERKEGQTFIWGVDRTPWEIDFRELDVHPYAWFVDRARFDQLLLDRAREAGAVVEEGRAVTRVLFEGGRAVGVVDRGDGGERTRRARFVIDASGQSAVVARGASLRRIVRGLKNVAMWAYWEGAERLPGHQRAHILTTSVPEGWIWAIPLGRTTSVGVVTSAATKGERERLGATAWYEATVDASEPVRALLRGARRVGDVTGARDWSYRARRLSGPGILLAGDAACFIDPILSTGVHLAMTAAYWSAAVVHASLEEPRHEPIFRRFYDETYGTTYRELLEQVKSFYRAEGRRDSIYWSAKKVLRVGSAVAPERAFLFITAGLLRNAASARPHDPLAQARTSLGERSGDAGRDDAKALVSPPLVLRAGRGESAELVSIAAKGMRLEIVRHEPRGVRDRPRGEFVALDFADETGAPLALAIVEERRRASKSASGRLAVTLLPYPVRERDAALLARLEQRLQSALAEVDDGRGELRLRRVRLHLRRLLANGGGLPRGVVVAREPRGGGVAEPALTAVYESVEPSPLPRIYAVAEARVPPELVEIPRVRTRSLDLWIRPGKARDGRDVEQIRGARELVSAIATSFWENLATKAPLSAAFETADETFRNIESPAYRLLACGRLGDGASDV